MLALESIRDQEEAVLARGIQAAGPNRRLLGEVTHSQVVLEAGAGPHHARTPHRVEHTQQAHTPGDALHILGGVQVLAGHGVPRQVQAYLRGKGAQGGFQRLRVEQVALDEVEVGGHVGDAAQVGAGAHQRADAAALANQKPGRVRSDEPGGAGEKDAHSNPL